MPETDPPRTDIQSTRVQWLDVAGAPAGLSGLRRRARLRPQRRRQVRLPRRGPDRPRRARATRSARTSARCASGPCRTAGGRSSSAPATCTPAASTSTSRSRATAPTPARSTATTRREVRPLFRSDAQYYEPAGAVSWDVSMEATRPDWRISLKAGDTVSINVTYDVKKASWYESMGILPLVDQPLRRPGRQGPVRRRGRGEGDVRRGRHPHPRPPAREHRQEGAQGPQDPRPAQAAQQGPQGRRRTGSTINGFGYSLGGFSALQGLPDEPDAPADDPAGPERHLHQLRRAAGDAATTSRPGTRVTSCSAPCNRGSGIGYPLAQRADQVRLGPARLRHRARAPR